MTNVDELFADVAVTKRQRKLKALRCHAVLTPDPLITPARKYVVILLVTFEVYLFIMVSYRG